MSKAWSMPIRMKLKELHNKHGLTWLHFSMSYHTFSNLREILQEHLNWELMEGIISHDFMDWPCNCNNVAKIDGKGIFNGNCRKMCVVYKVTCQVCDMFYIGNTQQKINKASIWTMCKNWLWRTWGQTLLHGILPTIVQKEWNHPTRQSGRLWNTRLFGKQGNAISCKIIWLYEREDWNPTSMTAGRIPSHQLWQWNM